MWPVCVVWDAATVDDDDDEMVRGGYVIIP